MIIGNKIVRQSDIHGNGIFMESCNYNSFIYNYFSNLFCGMDLKGSFSNYIYQNTFVKNIRNARIYECSILCNKWDRNYWNRPRLMPKIIFGLDPFGTEKEIWIDVDWHPAKQPYDIPKVTI